MEEAAITPVLRSCQALILCFIFLPSLKSILSRWSILLVTFMVSVSEEFSDWSIISLNLLLNVSEIL